MTFRRSPPFAGGLCASAKAISYRDSLDHFVLPLQELPGGYDFLAHEHLLEQCTTAWGSTLNELHPVSALPVDLLNGFYNPQREPHSFEVDTFIALDSAWPSFGFESTYPSGTDLTACQIDHHIELPNESHPSVNISLSPAIDTSNVSWPIDDLYPAANLDHSNLTARISPTQSLPTLRQSLQSTRTQLTPLMQPSLYDIVAGHDAPSDQHLQPCPSPSFSSSSTSSSRTPAHIQCTWPSCKRQFPSMRDYK